VKHPAEEGKMDIPTGKVIKEWIDSNGNKRKTIEWDYRMEIECDIPEEEDSK